MKKVILTDLDHTLLRSDGSISASTLNVIRKCRESGMQFIIATARYWIGAERYIKLLEPDYVISTDGTLVHHGDELIYSRELSAEATNSVIRELLAFSDKTEITAAVGKKVFWNSEHISESEKLSRAVYSDYSSPLPFGANKIVAQLADEHIAIETAKKHGCRLQCYRGENWYAFLPEGAGKVDAIMRLAEISELPLSDFTAFGDDENDIEMLKMCGTGVAVENAVPAVKAVADCVTTSNDNEGVANWLQEHYLL